MDDQQESTSSYLPGAASLIEQLDKRIMIILRDGKHLVGKLRSFDHFMNLILEETFERLMHSGNYIILRNVFLQILFENYKLANNFDLILREIL